MDRNNDKMACEIAMDKNKLESKKTMNMLGIQMDNELNFTPHATHLTGAMRKYNGFISDMLKYTGPKSVSLMSKSFMHGKLSHGLAYMTFFKSQYYKQWQFQVNKLLNKKFSTKEERKLLKEFQLISQYILLYRSFCISFNNLHRMAQMTRMNSILSTAYPVWEFEKLVNCFYQPNYGRTRNVETIPFFRPSRSNVLENRRTITTAPMIWSKEFNRLPSKIRSTIGTKYFNDNIKKYYKSRCQHQEHTLALCRGCNNTTDIYSNDEKMKKFNENWSKENIKDKKKFENRVKKWYEGQGSGKKVLMYLEEKDINNQYHDSKLH